MFRPSGRSTPRRGLSAGRMVRVGIPENPALYHPLTPAPVLDPPPEAARLPPTHLILADLRFARGGPVCPSALPRSALGPRNFMSWFESLILGLVQGLT